MHTTASDGRCTPATLVARARAAGLGTISVTDHDTVAAIPEVAALCREAGLALVPGIEITAVHGGHDVHVLGYFFDPDEPRLAAFLATQQAIRIDRVRRVGRRLDDLGLPIDVDAILAPVLDHPGRSIGRPQIARALVARGYVSDTNEAFDRYLGEGKPAAVTREGASPVEVVRLIAAAGGIASIAHPGQTHIDELIPAMAGAGMRALEVYHPDHPGDIRLRYAELAQSLDLAASGGSDYHGTDEHGASSLGTVLLPEPEFEALAARSPRPWRAP